MPLTETGDAHLLLMVTPVETTAAPLSDDAMATLMHAERDRTERLLSEPLVDTSSLDAPFLGESQRDAQMDLVGPTWKNARR